ncbi:MAG: DUF6508 domain-containing protein [Parafilimonas sp.]
MLLTKEQINYLLQTAKIFADASQLYTIQTESLTMMPYIYGKEINDYIKWMYENELVVQGYSTIEKNYLDNYTNDTWYANLTEKEVIKCLAFAIRRDRFVDGFLIHTITNKSFEKLVNHLKQIHNG